MALNVKIYNQAGKETGELELSRKVFGVGWKPQLVHEVAEAQRSSRRRRVAKVKDRAEVRGGGRKPWRQKGTGRARHGSIRSPLWVGGGVTHGPTAERSYEKKVNKKARRQAFLSALSRKLAEGEILFLDRLEITDGKTKKGAEIMRNLSKVGGFENLNLKKTLVLLPRAEGSSIRALRNLENVEVWEARNSNLSGLLSHKFVLLPQESVKVLENTFAP